jgi:hypothetical protein
MQRNDPAQVSGTDDRAVHLELWSRKDAMTMLTRIIITDVVQGIIVGGVLGFITFQILTSAYVPSQR